jgi:hypothetical protein
MNILSLTIWEYSVARIDLDLNEEVPVIEMLGSLRARLSSFLRQEDTTLVILVKCIFK